MTPIIKELKDFLSQKRIERKWLETTDINVYVRNTDRIAPNLQSWSCLTIGNIYVRNPCQGIFTKFLLEAHALNPTKMTYIEGVDSKRFMGHLVTLGFLPIVKPVAIHSLRTEMVDFYLPTG